MTDVIRVWRYFFGYCAEATVLSFSPWVTFETSEEAKMSLQEKRANAIQYLGDRWVFSERRRRAIKRLPMPEPSLVTTLPMRKVAK